MKKVALINDLSGLGRCSLTAAIPVISVMGHEACPLPTAILSAQTGFENYYCDDYSDRMNSITDHWASLDFKFDGICSGYMGNIQQMESTMYFLDKFNTPETIYLVDPIMGDNGHAIKGFSKELLHGMKELVKRADVITPNLTEMCMLANADYNKLATYNSNPDYVKRVTFGAGKLLERYSNLKCIVVTGVLREGPSAGKTGRTIGNLVVEQGNSAFYETPYNGRSFSGTGDLLAAVVIGGMLRGEKLSKTVQRAMDFLGPAIADSSKRKTDRNYGVDFEKYLSKLI